MDSQLSSKILFIGIDYRNPIGGIASVENEYSKFIKPFKFIRTSSNTPQLEKALIVLEGLLKFTWTMLTDSNIKIVHVNAASDASFWRKRIFISLAKIFNKKIVYHNHGGGFKRFTSQHPKAVQRTLAKVDCIVALSEDWANFFNSQTSCQNVKIIKNVVPLPQTKPLENGEHDTKKIMQLTFLGKITPEKGIYDLVELIAENKDLYNGRIHLSIGGNGETAKLQKEIYSKGLENIVTFVGWVNGDKKEELLNSTDVYVLPSYYEGLPISILEAMAHKKAIISTTVGGIPEIVIDSENGFLITPGDKQALKCAIDKLLQDATLRTKMGKNSFQKVQPYFPENVDKSLCDLYQSLL